MEIKAVKHTKEQNNILLVVVMTSLMTTFNASSLNLSIPAIGTEFGASAQLVGWIVTLFALLNVAFSLPFGKIADLTDRVRIFRIGVLFFTLGNFLSVFAVNIWMVIASRGIQGIAAAMIWATNMAMLLDAFEPWERGKILGYSVSATYIGLSIGPVLGGIINNYFGWRYIMLITGIYAAFTTLIAYTKLKPEDKKKVQQGRDFETAGKPARLGGVFDAKGSILYTISMILCMYGLATVGSGWLCYALIAGGVILAIAFVKCERLAVDPVVKISMFKNPGFTYSSLAAFMNYAATFAVSYYMSIYLQVVKGVPSQFAGLVLITSPIIQAIFSPMAGRLSDKHSPYKLSSAGMGICSISLLLLCTLNEGTSIAMVVLMLAIMGSGFALFSSPNTNAIMSAVDNEDRGIASSIISTMRNAGASASMAVITVIVGM